MKKSKKEKENKKNRKSQLIEIGSFLIILICLLTIGMTLLLNVKTNKEDSKKIENFFNEQEVINTHNIDEVVNTEEDIKEKPKINYSSEDYIAVLEIPKLNLKRGIYAKDSSNITIDDNIIRENNYGIKYGYGVFNTKIINNEIADCIGLYIMTVPEGPSGYGIFLNNSGVNVTINNNHIYSNHIGISLDANHTTGIVITQNTITDNVLEGIRFNSLN